MTVQVFMSTNSSPVYLSLMSIPPLDSGTCECLCRSCRVTQAVHTHHTSLTPQHTTPREYRSHLHRYRQHPRSRRILYNVIKTIKTFYYNQQEHKQKKTPIALSSDRTFIFIVTSSSSVLRLLLFFLLFLSSVLFRLI